MPLATAKDMPEGQSSHASALPAIDALDSEAASTARIVSEILPQWVSSPRSAQGDVS